MIGLLSDTFGLIPDARRPDRVDSSLHDTLMSGFTMMFFQHASLLEFQRKMHQCRGRCNLETIFGGHEVPSDTQMREIGDGVPVEVLRHVLPEFFAKVRRAGWAKDFKSTVPSGFHRGDYYTAMLDGSQWLFSLDQGAMSTLFAMPRYRWRGAFPPHGGVGHPGEDGFTPGVAPRCGRSLQQRWPGQTGL
jgi:hypothetical protein